MLSATVERPVMDCVDLERKVRYRPMWRWTSDIENALDMRMHEEGGRGGGLATR